jgi:hypothetical protein
MSDDLVNQITLNFLISKQQLQKLNKRIKQKEEDKMKTDMEIYKDKFVELFLKMTNNELPSDLLEDVNHSYNYFVEKAIYYLKMKESSSTEEDDEVAAEEQEEPEAAISEEEDLDAESRESETEEEETVASLEEEESRESESDEDKTEDLEEDELNEEEEDLEEELKIKTSPIAAIKETRYKKFTNTKSKGVDDIQQLPLDWFSKVRQTYKQNQIIPRHKDEDKKGVVLESPTNYKNTEKKNINRLYEDKTNDKNKKTTK